MRVLFVCLGNICRSPMAEAVFAHKVREAGLEDKIFTDSAGTGNWHAGKLPHNGTLKVLARHAIPTTHLARQITLADLNEFDYILTMDDQNYFDVTTLGKSSAMIVRLLDFAPESGIREVPDPFFTGGFEGVYELVDVATDGLLAELQSEILYR